MTDSSLTVRPALPRGVLILIGAAGAVITVAGMRAVGDMISLVFLALMITIAISPVMAAMMRRGIPTWLATVICVLIVYLSLLALSLALILAVASFADLLPAYEAKFDRLMHDVGAWLQTLGVQVTQLDDLLVGLDLNRLAGVVASLLGSIVGIASSLFFVCALVLFMTMDAAQFPRLLSLTDRARPQVVAAFRSFASGTRRYLWVSTVFGLIVAVLDVGALIILGIPAPWLWGLLAFLTNYIPNVGFVIGLVPPAILGLLEGGPGLMLSVIAVYSVINAGIQSVIQPKVMGDSVGLSATLTFVSLVFWAWVLGPLGALLALPLTLLVKAVFVEVDPGSRWLLPLLAGSDKEYGAGGAAPPVDRDASEVDHLAASQPQPSEPLEPPPGVAVRRSQ